MSKYGVKKFDSDPFVKQIDAILKPQDSITTVFRANLREATHHFLTKQQNIDESVGEALSVLAPEFVDSQDAK